VALLTIQAAGHPGHFPRKCVPFVPLNRRDMAGQMSRMSRMSRYRSVQETQQ
jgi:hypothetical protein